MSTDQPPPPFPVTDVLLAYHKTAALRAAIELKVFDSIGAGATSVGDIASATGAAPHGIRILCDYLTLLCFLQKSGSNYTQTPLAAAYLDTRSPMYLGSMATFLAGPEMARLFLSDPASYVRQGGTEGPGNMGPNDPIWVTFARSMAPSAGAAAMAVAAHAAGGGKAPAKVLDVAAGGGMFGIAMARTFPEAQVIAVDWENVLSVARENAKKAQLGGRYHTMPGDAFTVAWGGDYNLVLLPHFLHHFDRARCVTMLSKVRNSLASEGRTLIVEFVPNEDRISPPIPAGFAFMMLGTTQSGDAYTFEEYTAMGRDAGFRASRRSPLGGLPDTIIELLL